MGNCALKPKVLMTAGGAPAPEELQISLLDDHKVDAAKSLSNLFLQDKAEKKTKEDEKAITEKVPVTDDLKTALAEAKSPTKEIKYPATETEPLVTETQSPVNETTVPDDDQKVRKEETVCEEKVIDDVTVKKTEAKTEAKPEEVIKEEAAAP
ncbi:unnamed protein product [Eruca vesicaria subsp. sativa]|uniref:Uncharacterized protein n=1 Tax=Eruca vesicaria subsp. sativa TaxID=29727 RepID=A0ABC8K5I7_ERUVS|nr:unnamed protein product [Eruca vesicaria subsp. sativa]